MKNLEKLSTKKLMEIRASLSYKDKTQEEQILLRKVSVLCIDRAKESLEQEEKIMRPFLGYNAISS